MPLPVLLSLCNVTVPHDCEVVVEDAPGVLLRHGTVKVQHGAVLKLRLGSALDQIPSMRTTDSDPQVPDCDPSDKDSADNASPRSRSPAERTSRPTAAPSCESLASTVREHCAKWNRSLHCNTALCLRRPEDTPGNCSHLSVLPVAAPVPYKDAAQGTWPGGCKLQPLCIHTEEPVVVFDTCFLLPIHELVREPFGHPMAPLGEASESENPDMWRVGVCVLQYQRVPQYTSLWVASGERLCDVRERACIILNQDNPQAEVELVDPSPFPDMLTCVLVPGSWKDMRISLFVVQWPPEAADPFADVANPESTVADFAADMPAAIGKIIEFRLSGVHHFTSPFVPCVILSGTLLSIFPANDPLPELPSAQQTVEDPSVAVPTTHGLPGVTACDKLWLLLGPYSEQIVVERNQEAEDIQLPAACDIRAEDAVVCHCKGRFKHVAVRGMPIARCVSVRTRRISGQHHRAQVVFIDARLLGVPICTRVFFASQISAEALLDAIDVEVPDGFCLGIVEAESGRMQHPPLSIENGSAFLLWLEKNSAACEASMGEDEPGRQVYLSSTSEDSPSDASHRHHRARSRSSRGLRSGSCIDDGSCVEDVDLDDLATLLDIEMACGRVASAFESVSRNVARLAAGPTSCQQPDQAKTAVGQTCTVRALPTPCRAYRSAPACGAAQPQPAPSLSPHGTGNACDTQPCRLAEALGPAGFNVARHCVTILPPGQEMLFWGVACALESGKS